MIPPRPVFRPFLDSGSYSSAGGAAGRRMNVKRSGSWRGRGKNRRPFLWALITTFNLFLVVGLWVTVSTLLSQPERPICYKVLGILGQQPEIQALERKDLAMGMNSLSAQEAEQKYAGLNHLQMEELNAQLLRGYITNFRRSQEVPIMQGEYELVGARLLTQEDFIETGIVLLARSTDLERGSVYLEYILPTAAENVPKLRELELMLEGGQGRPRLKLRASKQLAALTQVSRLENAELLLSVIPVSYQSPRFAQGRQLALQAPQKLNLEKGLPIYEPSTIKFELDSSELSRELAAVLDW